MDKFAVVAFRSKTQGRASTADVYETEGDVGLGAIVTAKEGKSKSRLQIKSNNTREENREIGGVDH